MYQNPASALRSASTLSGLAGKSATPSYWNAMSVVFTAGSTVVSVGAGWPNVASRIGTVPSSASRSNRPPFGRWGSPMRTKEYRSGMTPPLASASCRLTMFDTVAPCEYPKITMSPPGSAVLAAAIWSLRLCTPLATDTFHLAPLRPPQPANGNGQNCAM